MNLAQMAPGSELAAVLSTVQLNAVPDEALLEVLSAQSRQLAHQQAQVWATMVEIGSRDAGMPWTEEQKFASAVDEIRAELRVNRRAVENELTRAEQVAA